MRREIHDFLQFRWRWWMSSPRYEWARLKEQLMMWVAWKLPRWLAYWATIRTVAHASQGPWSNQLVPDLRAMDVLKRWDEPTPDRWTQAEIDDAYRRVDESALKIVPAEPATSKEPLDLPPDPELSGPGMGASWTT